MASSSPCILTTVNCVRRWQGSHSYCQISEGRYLKTYEEAQAEVRILKELSTCL